LSPHELGTDIKEFKPGLRRAMVDLLLIRSLKKDKRKKKDLNSVQHASELNTSPWVDHKHSNCFALALASGLVSIFMKQTLLCRNGLLLYIKSKES